MGSNKKKLICRTEHIMLFEAPIAQLAVRMTSNHKVAGSSPARCISPDYDSKLSSKALMPERLRGTT